jgi:hypothetical protein
MVRYTSDFGGFPAAFQFNEKIASTPEGSFSTESVSLRRPVDHRSVTAARGRGCVKTPIVHGSQGH